MQVLLTETSTPAAREAAQALGAAGHGVHHCYPDGDGTQCVADAGERCPLDRDPIDVVVVLRAGDDGSRCAVRHKVPFVLAEPTTDVVTAVDATAAQPMCGHSMVATDMFQRSLRTAGLPSAGASAEVRRRDGYLRVTLMAPVVVPEVVAQRGAVRICQALREVDPDARGIDVVSPKVVDR